jgi:hypothetical protein
MTRACGNRLGYGSEERPYMPLVLGSRLQYIEISIYTLHVAAVVREFCIAAYLNSSFLHFGNRTAIFP